MRLIVSFLFCVLGLGLVGCSHIEVYKGYKPVSTSIMNGMSVTMSIDVTARDVDKRTTVYGEPYTMLVDVFYTQSLARIELRNASLQGNIGLLELDDKGFELPENEDGLRQSVTFRFDLEDEEYERKEFKGELVVLEGEQEFLHELIVVMEPDHRKREINKHWENLMGI